MDPCLREKMRRLTKEFLTQFDDNREEVRKNIQLYKERVRSDDITARIKDLQRNMDCLLASRLAINEENVTKEAIERKLENKREEVESLRRVVESNAATKAAKQQELVDFKQRVDALKAKISELREHDSSESVVAERLLMKQLGITLKQKKDGSFYAVLWKDAEEKVVERLIALKKENDENDFEQQFWYALEKASRTK